MASCQVADTPGNLQIDPADTYQVLSSLNPSKAMGLDEISPKVLKYCACAIFEPLTHLFQLCIDQGFLPQEWKLHVITPIFKSGDRSMISNYRPISLLCIVSKVLEMLVFDHIIGYLSATVINPSQFGFLKGKSTIQQLLVFLEHIHSEMRKGGQVDSIYLDFRKAFDSVSHPKLLLKLSASGITGNLWLWFKGYLSDRYQCTSIEQCKSSFLPVLSGVPQGSILGPILFIIYINDLPGSVNHSRVLSFADDTKCYKGIHESAHAIKLQQDLDGVGQSSSVEKLDFNIGKFALVRFHSRQTQFNTSYSMNGVEINEVMSHKDLGIIL